MNAKHDEKIRETQLEHVAKGFIDQFNFPRRQSSAASTELPQQSNGKIALRPALVEAFGLQDAWQTWTQDQLVELCATTLRDELIEARRVPKWLPPVLDPNYSFRTRRLARHWAAQEPSYRAVAPCKYVDVEIRKRPASAH
jgi:hypothetical protein